MCQSLDKLKELTDKLPGFPKELVSSKTYKKYEMEAGSCYGWLLYTNITSVACHKWYCSKGTIFPAHTHEVRELLQVYEGQMILTVDGKEITLNSGESYHIEPGIIHSSIHPKETRFITITTPPAMEFPGESEGEC